MRKPVETAVLFSMICFGIFMMSSAGAQEEPHEEALGYGKARLTGICPDAFETDQLEVQALFNWPTAR